MKDVVLGMAENYTESQLDPFVGSLRRTGFDGDIVLFTHAGNREIGSPWSRTHQVQFIELPWKRRLAAPCRWLFALRRQISAKMCNRDEFLSQCWLQDITNGRYALYYDFLLANSGRYRHILLSDVRDVVFQTSPFQRALPADLCLFAEHDSCTIGTSGATARWLQRFFGEKTLRELQDKQVVCAGVVMGTEAGIFQLIERMVDTMVLARSFWALRFGLDQAALNYLVHTGGLPNVQVFECLRGPAVHLALLPADQLKMDDDGQVLNENGSVIPLLHQYDRQVGFVQRAQESKALRAA